MLCLFVLFHVYSTVRSTAFTTKDIVVSGSDDRTVKVWFTFLQFLITEIATMEDFLREWESCRYCSLLFILVNLFFLLIRLPVQAVSRFARSLPFNFCVKFICKIPQNKGKAKIKRNGKLYNVDTREVKKSEKVRLFFKTIYAERFSSPA